MGKRSRRESFDKSQTVKQNRIETDSNAETATQTKIVDIDNYCLERIFELLAFRDLVYVAEANKYLGAAAATVFKRKLKKRTIIIEFDCYPNIVIYDNAICIHDSLLAVQMIRRFGQSIFAIQLKFSRDRSLDGKFFVHVNEYCHKTLNNLLTSGDYSKTFSAAKYSFENVDEFILHKGAIGPGCEHFNRLFPHLRQLTFVDTFILDWKCI